MSCKQKYEEFKSKEETQIMAFPLSLGYPDTYELQNKISFSGFRHCLSPEDIKNTLEFLYKLGYDVTMPIKEDDCEHENKQSLFHHDRHVGYYCPDCDTTYDINANL